MKTFNEALAYLYSFVSYEQKSNWSYNDKTLNLENYKRFLSRMGSPQMAVPIVHVAGSDGKGSTCAMIATVLEASGYRVGLYQSPHLHHIRERIQINQACIPQDDFLHWTGELKTIVDELCHPENGYATFFELITAMAYLYFREQQVDFAVIETGLGGRLDATNVASPLVTAITRISMEHTHLLGDTLEKIANEKLGIARDTAPMIVGPQEETLLPHFRERLSNHPGGSVFVQEDYRITHRSIDARQQQLNIKSASQSRDIRLSLRGEYQADNARTALAVVDSLIANGHAERVTEASLLNGFERVRIPGRFEIIERKQAQPLVLDVAHTVRGAHALRESLDSCFPDSPCVFVFGALKDKPVAEMLGALNRPGDRFVLTTAPTPRGMPANQLAETISGLSLKASVIESPGDALAQTLGDATSDDVVIGTGSLYLVGSLRDWLIEERMLAALD